MTTRHAQRRYVTWLARADITRPTPPHALRHTFASRLLARTGDLRLVQEALLRRSIAATRSTRESTRGD